MRYWLSLEVCRDGSRRLKGLFAPVMSARMYFLDFYVYPPLIILCLIVAFKAVAAGKLPEMLALVIFGYLMWTLVEYLAHRYVFHHIAGFRGLHEAHHAEPNELIGSPTIFSLAIFYCLAYWPIASIWGVRPAAAFLAGLLTGYLSYVLVHYAVHHFGSHGFRLMKKLKRQHALHHHVSQQRYFGVTTSFWDKVFGTN